jgi:hypothetical protein
MELAPRDKKADYQSAAGFHPAPQGNQKSLADARGTPNRRGLQSD